MRERPDDFLFNPNATLAEGLMFAGLLGDGCAGSMYFRDSSLFDNHGVAVNMAPGDVGQWVGELGRRGTRFDGVDDYVSLDRTQTEWMSAGTYSVWFAPKPTGTVQYLLDSTSARRYLVLLHSRIECFAGDTNLLLYWTVPVDFYDKIWHLAFTWQSGAAITGELYINGSLRVQSTTAWSPQISVQAWIGKRHNDVHWFKGLIADPLIFNRALTPSEIQALADPSNTMLSVGGSPLLLPPRRELFTGWSAAAPLSLTGAALDLPSPYTNGDPVDTAVATGGSAPIAYSVVSQSSDVEVLKVTGTLTPDATGYSVAAGTHNGEPYYSWEADGTTWYNWLTFTDPVRWELSDVAPGGGFDPGVNAGWERYDNSRLGEYVPINTTGTATVAVAAPFAVNSSTGAITVADAGALVVGHTWTLVVRATDDLLDTADGTWTITMVAATAIIPHIMHHRRLFGATASCLS